MNFLLLTVTVLLALAAIRSHMISKVHVKTKIEKQWFDRLWSGDRPSRDNLTEEGLRYRNQSNLFAIAGLLAFVVYVLL
ncbi:MAG: hypothetical protein KTR32_27565 [Granulosicoccus sp.]|nr:hypothetical protein [Granulosicoccus sp.]